MPLIASTVFSHFHRREHTWIGFTDKITEGTFVWADGNSGNCFVVAKFPNWIWNGFYWQLGCWAVIGQVHSFGTLTPVCALQPCWCQKNMSNSDKTGRRDVDLPVESNQQIQLNWSADYFSLFLAQNTQMFKKSGHKSAGIFSNGLRHPIVPKFQQYYCRFLKILSLSQTTFGANILVEDI